MSSSDVKWQPIETAPKDGTRLLLFCGSYSVQIGAWEKVFHVDMDGNAVGAWTDFHPVHLYSGEYLELLPSHWMPLPSPPKDSPNV